MTPGEEHEQLTLGAVEAPEPEAPVRPAAEAAAIGPTAQQRAAIENRDRDVFVEHKPSFADILRSLRAMGATNALTARRHALSGRARFAAAEAAHPREPQGLPMRWEAIYAQAWAPEPGTPMRDAHGELAQMPVSSIPIRRRR